MELNAEPMGVLQKTYTLPLVVEFGLRNIAASPCSPRERFQEDEPHPTALFNALAADGFLVTIA
jgi:hypothetical protein